MRQDLRIVVEGMDGAGKTTLISKLVNDFDELEIVRNPEGPDRDFNVWWPQELDRQKSDRVPIHDRFFWSELVYGPILRGRLAVGEILINNVVLFLRQTALLIYVRPHSEIVLNAIKLDDHIPGVFEKKRELLGLYDNLMAVEAQWMKQRFLRYDWNNPTHYGWVARTINRYLDGKLYE